MAKKASMKRAASPFYFDKHAHVRFRDLLLAQRLATTLSRTRGEVTLDITPPEPRPLALCVCWKLKRVKALPDQRLSGSRRGKKTRERKRPSARKPS